MQASSLKEPFQKLAFYCLSIYVIPLDINAIDPLKVKEYKGLLLQKCCYTFDKVNIGVVYTPWSLKHNDSSRNDRQQQELQGNLRIFLILFFLYAACYAYSLHNCLFAT